jgi:hypothetical protein
MSPLFRGSTVAEHLTRNYKFEGSNPARRRHRTIVNGGNI